MRSLLRTFSVILSTLIISNITYACYGISNIDTYTQGDGSTFDAYYEIVPGYIYRFTNDGYAIIPTKINNKLYYAYAILNSEGWYISSDSLVNINNPLPASYQLMPSSTALDSINVWYNQHISALDEIEQNYPLDPDQYNFNVAVFMVKYGGDINYDEDHNFINYNNMLNGDNYYDPEGDDNPSPHPDGDPVFGSLKQYFHDSSLGCYTFNFDIINVENNEIEWIVLDDYTNYPTYSRNDVRAIRAIISNTVFPDINPNDYDFAMFLKYPQIPDGVSKDHPDVYLGATPNAEFCIILSNSSESKNLPACISFAKYGRQVGSLSATDWSPGFPHIGTMAHEITHRLGCADIGSRYASIMGTGNNCGPNNEGECPSLWSWQELAMVNSGALWNHLVQTGQASISNITNEEDIVDVFAINKYDRNSQNDNICNVIRIESVVPRSNDIFYIEARKRHYGHFDEFNGYYGGIEAHGNDIIYDNIQGYYIMPNINSLNLYLYRTEQNSTRLEAQHAVTIAASSSDCRHRDYGYGEAEQYMPGPNNVLYLGPYTGPPITGKHDEYTGISLEILEIDNTNGRIRCYIDKNETDIYEVESGETIEWQYGTIPIDKILYVCDGGTLMVGGQNDDTHIMFAPDAGIVVDPGGTLIVDNDPYNNGSIKRTYFEELTPNQDPWFGIQIYSGNNTYFHNTTITDAGVCALAVSNGSSLEMEGCNISDNERGILVANLSQVQMENTVIENNDQAGLKAFNYVDLYVDDSYVSTSGSGIASNSGTVLYGAMLNSHCSNYTDNEGTGIYSFNGHVRMSQFDEYGNIIFGYNEISGNFGDPSIWAGQMYLSGSSIAELYQGHNAIIDADLNNPLIGSDGLTRTNWQENWWGTTQLNEIEGRIPEPPPGGPVISPIDDHQYLCDEVDPTPPNDNDLLMFYNAFDLENQSMFAEAKEDYEELIATYPNSKYAVKAVDRILICNKKLNGSFQDLRYYFQDVADTTTSPELKQSALNSAAWCLVEMGQYTDAELEYQALIDTSVTLYDSIAYSLSIVMLEIKELDSLGTLYIANNKNEARIAKMVEEKQRRYVNSINKADRLLEQLTVEKVKNNKHLPSDYALGDIYPNPFNSSLIINYSLPKNSDVRIEVYNLLGQKITTLVRRRMSAGNNQIVWNPGGMHKNVASGIYFVHMQADEFTSTRKVFLLK